MEPWIQMEGPWADETVLDDEAQERAARERATRTQPAEPERGA